VILCIFSNPFVFLWYFSVAISINSHFPVHSSSPYTYPLVQLHRSVHSVEFTQLAIPQYIFESFDRSHSLSQRIAVKFNPNSDGQDGKASLVSTQLLKNYLICAWNTHRTTSRCLLWPPHSLLYK
jgi:hypothetical protein